MAKYRDYLPQIDGDFCLTHGWLDTTSVLQGDVDISPLASIEMLHGMRIAQKDRLPIVVSGSIGPRRDGFTEADEMHPRKAARYHKPQIERRGCGFDHGHEYIEYEPSHWHCHSSEECGYSRGNIVFSR